MFKRLLFAGGLAMMAAALVAGQTAGQTAPPAAPARPAPAAPVVPVDASAQRAVVDKYCVGCHNARLKTAGLMLDQLDLAHLPEHAEIGEKVVRKLRAGMMPPLGMPRPDRDAREALISWMENELDRGAASNLTAPGLHRLNRVEYRNAIRDLLDLDVDTAKFLPSDTSTHGFDNIAGALTMSPALMEAYLSAAGKISRLAVGSASDAAQVEFNVPDDATQNYHVEGLPFGTRGGILIEHEFPADGNYIFKITPVAEGNMGQANNPFGQIKGEKLEVTVDGERVKLYDWDKEMQGFGVRFGVPTPAVPIKAGLHRVGVGFLATNYAPDNNVNDLFLRATIETGGIPGYTFFPHVGKVRIDGPFDASGVSDTASRRRIFLCRPANEVEEEACARKIVSSLARRAYRRPVTTVDIATLMTFYASGRSKGTFDDGIEKALRRLLADPEFVYRGETAPAGLAAGKSYRISDLALASRLSFFLWSSIPDEELLTLAAQRRLREPAVLERQVQRMLADPKSEAFVENFTGQWLNLRAFGTFAPNPSVYPDFDDNLRQGFRREVELFFGSIVQEDRSILDLLTADYTFVDERVAAHYGIPNVYGSRFRRITLAPEFDMRRGLLGKGALLSVTSQATRTSPVARGKWFLQTFLGVSPPDPPPNVPAVKPPVQDMTGNAKEPTMRERMASHHSNAVCATCHNIFEPIGLAMENFDAVGAWRTMDEGQPIDATGVLVDGRHIDGVASLRDVLSGNSDQFARVVVEKMLTYALGRGVEYQDMPLVRAIVHDSAASRYKFSSLILGVVKSAPFQYNAKGADVIQRTAR